MGFSAVAGCLIMLPMRRDAGAGMGSDGETSVETPGRRTDGERQAIVAEAFEDGNSVSESPIVTASRQHRSTCGGGRLETQPSGPRGRRKAGRIRRHR